MASSRTTPLDIRIFFKRKGKQAEPLGILLYAREIPFEIILNLSHMPAIVSMVPGNVVHRIEKLTSASFTLDDLLHGFNMGMQGPDKIFIIDEINVAPYLGRNQVSNVVIYSNSREFNAYGTFHGFVYSLPDFQLAPMIEDQYFMLLEIARKKLKRDQLSPETVATIEKTLTQMRKRQAAQLKEK